MSPRLHDGQQVADDLGGIALFGVANVDHQGDAGLFGGPLGQAGHFQAHDLQGRRNHAGLDAANGSVALLNNLYGALQVDAAGGEDVGRGGQTGAADVQEGDDLGGVVGDDVGREPAIGVAAAAAGVHHGGYAGAHAADVGVDAVAIDSLVHVGMQVDEAGDDVLAAYLDHAGRLVGCDVGGHRGDFAVGDGDVVGAVQVLRGVNYRAAFDEQVVHTRVPSDASVGCFPAAASVVSGGNGVKAIDHQLIRTYNRRPIAQQTLGDSRRRGRTMRKPIFWYHEPGCPRIKLEPSEVRVTPMGHDTVIVKEINGETFEALVPTHTLGENRDSVPIFYAGKFGDEFLLYLPTSNEGRPNLVNPRKRTRIAARGAQKRMIARLP